MFLIIMFPNKHDQNSSTPIDVQYLQNSLKAIATKMNDLKSWGTIKWFFYQLDQLQQLAIQPIEGEPFCSPHSNEFVLDVQVNDPLKSMQKKT